MTTPSKEQPVLPKDIDDAIDEFDESAMNWGWQEDQGYDGESIAASSARYETARIALRTIIAAAIVGQRPTINEQASSIAAAAMAQYGKFVQKINRSTDRDIEEAMQAAAIAAQRGG